jgi:hypothetical protein
VERQQTHTSRPARSTFSRRMEDLLAQVSQFQALAKEIADQIGNISTEFQNSLAKEKRTADEEISRLRAATTATANELQNKIETMKKKVEPFQEVITLNVGGTTFVTSLKTISSTRSKVLNVMFSGDISPPMQVNGAYFLDRNPSTFAHILDFLRGCDIVVRFEEKSQLLSLYDEAIFFEIPELIEQIGVKINPKIPPTKEKTLRKILNPRVLHISNQDQFSPDNLTLATAGIANLTTVRNPPQSCPLNVDSILVTTWSAVDTTILGNILADAVDRGITVVICQFAQSTSYTYPLGRFMNDQYYAITPAPCEGAPNALLGAISDPGHPIFVGISNISQGTDKRRCSGALAPGAELVAEWNDHKPLVAVRNDKNGLVVSISAQFGSVGVQGDGMKMLINALSIIKQ